MKNLFEMAAAMRSAGEAGAMNGENPFAALTSLANLLTGIHAELVKLNANLEKMERKD